VPFYVVNNDITYPDEFPLPRLGIEFLNKIKPLDLSIL
jgi:hypothetical protein